MAIAIERRIGIFSQKVKAQSEVVNEAHLSPIQQPTIEEVERFIRAYLYNWALVGQDKGTTLGVLQVQDLFLTMLGQSHSIDKDDPSTNYTVSGFRRIEKKDIRVLGQRYEAARRFYIDKDPDKKLLSGEGMTTEEERIVANMDELRRTLEMLGQGKLIEAINREVELPKSKAA